MKRKFVLWLCAAAMLLGSEGAVYASDFGDVGEVVFTDDFDSTDLRDARAEFTDGSSFLSDTADSGEDLQDPQEPAQDLEDGRIVENGLVYQKINEYSLGLVGYEGEPVDCVIPSEVQGMTVVRIGEGAFWSCNTLRSVQMPDTIRIIGRNTFRNCRNLEQVRLSNNLEGIPRDAFALCTGLLEIRIPGSVKGISIEAFALCASLKKVELGEGLRTIRDTSFSYCKSLKEIVIPSSVQKIEGSAFDGSGLEKVTFRNRSCVLQGNYIFPSKTVIYGYNASTAQAYAKQNGNPFVSMELPELERVSLRSMANVKGDSIRITWNPVVNADGYEVFRKKNGKWVKIGERTADTCSYIDRDTKIGYDYVYTVRAYAKMPGGTVYGKYYEYVSPLKQVFDDIPVEITDSRRLADSSLGIKWNTRKKAEGYQILRREAGGSWKLLKTVGKINSYRDKTCIPGTRYYYRVRAFARGADGKYSYSDDKAVSLISRLRQPSVKVMAAGSGQVFVSWSKQPGVSGYLICRRDKGTAGWTCIYTAGANSSSYMDKTVTSGKSYYYTVRPYKKADKADEIEKTIYGPYLKEGKPVTIQ